MPRKGSGPLPVDRACERCGTHFQIVPTKTRLAHGWGRFCSRACANAALEQPLEEQVRSRIVTSGPVPPHAPELGICWTWSGAHFKGGYGRLARDRGPGRPERTELAHRLSYELAYGPIPEGLLVCHKCDNPGCVRPDHLFLGTASDNRLDAIRKGRAVTPHAPSGERHGRTKLTDNAVRELRRLGDAGVSPGFLARRYDIDLSTVHRILGRQSWRHLE